MQMRWIKWGLGFFIVSGSILMVYTLWDNQRIIVREENIGIDDLPEELDGFTILQITDLHEKTFGENQRKLIDKVNSLEYDAIVFTGDMLDDAQSQNYNPTYDLLDGINNLDHALFVSGNTDPNHFEPISARTSDKHDFVKGMADRGVRPLESIYPMDVGEASVHFVEFEISLKDPYDEIAKLESSSQSAKEPDDEHLINLYEEMKTINDLSNEDILISLYHYPLVDQRIDIYQKDPSVHFRDYDLHIAGHYHGGQIRLPFLGALMVPEAYYDNYGLLPPQDRVMGYWEYDGLKQYVSAGLGSSRAVGFLNFRFLNPPEINLLTLKKE